MEEEDVVWSRLGGGAAAAAAAEAAAAAASGKGEAGEIGSWKPQSVGDPAQQASFQLHGQSVETADVPSVRHLLLPPVSASQGKEARGRVSKGGDRGGSRRAGLGRGARRPHRPRAQLLGLLTIALAWAEPGCARGGGFPESRSQRSGYRESRGGEGGGAATRQERTAVPFLAGEKGRVSRPRGAPRPARARQLADAWGPTAGPASRTAFRPLQGLALRAVTLGSPGVAHSTHPRPAPRDSPPAPARATNVAGGGRDRLLPASGPALPPLASDLCAVWHFTWLLISTFTLVFWVEKWPKFTPHSLMSLLIFSVAFT